jgi:hypothetical protein
MLPHIVTKRIWQFIPTNHLLTCVIRVSKDVKSQVLDELGIRRQIMMNAPSDEQNKCILDRWCEDPYITPPDIITNSKLFFSVEGSISFNMDGRIGYILNDVKNKSIIKIVMRSLLRVDSIMVRLSSFIDNLRQYSIQKDSWVYIKLWEKYPMDPNMFISEYIDMKFTDLKFINFMLLQTMDKRLILHLLFKLIIIKYGINFKFKYMYSIYVPLRDMNIINDSRDIFECILEDRKNFVESLELINFREFEIDLDVIKFICHLCDYGFVEDCISSLRFLDVILMCINRFNCYYQLSSFKNIVLKLEQIEIMRMYLSYVRHTSMYGGSNELIKIFENIKLTLIAHSNERLTSRSNSNECVTVVSVRNVVNNYTPLENSTRNIRHCVVM